MVSIEIRATTGDKKELNHREHLIALISTAISIQMSLFREFNREAIIIGISQTDKNYTPQEIDSVITEYMESTIKFASLVYGREIKEQNKNES